MGIFFKILFNHLSFLSNSRQLSIWDWAVILDKAKGLDKEKPALKRIGQNWLNFLISSLHKQIIPNPIWTLGRGSQIQIGFRSHFFLYPKICWTLNLFEQKFSGIKNSGPKICCIQIFLGENIFRNQDKKININSLSFFNYLIWFGHVV